MTAPVDVLADLRKLANVGEYRELREAMEKCLRPHEREGFADLLGRMVGNASAIAELIEALDDDLNGDDPAEWCDDPASAMVERERVTKARRERLIAALARIGGA